MKKIIYSALALLGMTLSSCCDKNDVAADGGDTTVDPISTTIMILDCGGGNLDQNDLYSILAMQKSGASDKVNVIAQFKLSAQYQKDGENSTGYDAYQGVIRWDLADQGKEVSLPENTGYDFQMNWKPIQYLTQLKNVETVSKDAKYKLCTEENLIEFINYCKKKHPADHYILIPSDHGGGWSPGEDGHALLSKGVIYDDNLGSDQWYSNLDQCLEAKTIHDAIKNTIGKVDVLYLEACLMAQWENMSQWKDISDYMVLSQELSQGTQLSNLLENMKKTTSADQIFTSLCNTVDSNNKWWDDYSNTTKKLGKMAFVDQGVYRSSGVTAMEQIIKQAAAKMIELKDKNQDYTSDVIKTAIIPDGSNTYFSDDDKTKALGKKLYNAMVTRYQKMDNMTETVIPNDFIQVYYKENQSDFETQFTADEQFEIFTLMSLTAAKSVCMADLLGKWNSAVQDDAEHYGISEADKQAVQNIYDSYMKGLKEMAYVGMSISDKGNPYVQCSPSVCMFSMTEKGWVNKAAARADGVNANLSPFAENYSRESIEVAYMNEYGRNPFQSATGWGDFLQKNDINVNALVNPTRQSMYFLNK